MTQRLFGFNQKLSGIFSGAQGIGTHNAHAAQGEMTDSLSKPFQAGKRPVLSALIQNIVCIQSGCKSDHFPQAVNGLRCTLVQAANDHVKAVGAQVYGGNDFWWFDRQRVIQFCLRSVLVYSARSQLGFLIGHFIRWRSCKNSYIAGYVPVFAPCSQIK